MALLGACGASRKRAPQPEPERRNRGEGPHPDQPGVPHLIDFLRPGRGDNPLRGRRYLCRFGPEAGASVPSHEPTPERSRATCRSTRPYALGQDRPAAGAPGAGLGAGPDDETRGRPPRRLLVPLSASDRSPGGRRPTRRCLRTRRRTSAPRRLSLGKIGPQAKGGRASNCRRLKDDTTTCATRPSGPWDDRPGIGP